MFKWLNQDWQHFTSKSGSHALFIATLGNHQWIAVTCSATHSCCFLHVQSELHLGQYCLPLASNINHSLTHYRLQSANSWQRNYESNDIHKLRGDSFHTWVHHHEAPNHSCSCDTQHAATEHLHKPTSGVTLAVLSLNMAKFRVLKDYYVKQIVPTFVPCFHFYNKNVMSEKCGRN